MCLIASPCSLFEVLREECDVVEDICQRGHCENTEGSFVCHCPYGFVKTLDETQCVDKREGLCFMGVQGRCCKSPGRAEPALKKILDQNGPARP